MALPELKNENSSKKINVSIHFFEHNHKSIRKLISFASKSFKSFMYIIITKQNTFKQVLIGYDYV